ncbi:MAG TPA: DUF167 domain-containing protein [Steroidobacteraceae bacterium]|nr:DUF167 domain-containing protein [Steroidobacteraceae bacterium]
MPQAVRIGVYVQPRASRTELAGIHGGAIKIRIAAAALDNAANLALIEFVAARLGIAKRCVRLIAGAKDRNKVLEIESVTEEAVRAAIPGFTSPERRSSSRRK